jgi:hypothetical protein
VLNLTSMLLLTIAKCCDRRTRWERRRQRLMRH